MSHATPSANRTAVASLYPAGHPSPHTGPGRAPSRMVPDGPLDGLLPLKTVRVAQAEFQPTGSIEPGRRHGIFVGTGRRIVPLLAHEVQQAAYQLGAKLNGDALDASAAGIKDKDGTVRAGYADPRERQRLAEATQTMHETRLSLKYGRSNIAGESDATKNGNVARVLTAYDMCHAEGHSKGAGAALHLQAGDCDQNAWINTRMHAAKLHRGETVHTLTSVGMHTWSELHTHTQPGEPQAPDIVLDSWPNGPAVRLQHSCWAHTPVETGGPWESFDRETGLQARQEMLEAKLDFRNGTWAEANEMLALNQRSARMPARVYRENSVIAPWFARQAATGLAGKSALCRDIMAAGAARDAYGLSIRLAVDPQALRAVIGDAMNLDGLGRPPVEIPPR